MWNYFHYKSANHSMRDSLLIVNMQCPDAMEHPIISRRSFLETGARAGAAFVGEYFL